MKTIKPFILSFLCLICCSALSAAPVNPFLALSFDSICIYDFEWRTRSGMHLSIIDKEGNLASSVKKSARLDKKNAKELSKWLGEEKSYGQDVAACFEPHLGIIYYKDGKVTAHATICILCNQLKSSIRIPAQQQGKETYEGEVFYTRTGMSKAFRKYLDSLLKKYDFSHRPSSSIFD